MRDIGLVMIPFFKSLAHAAESSVLTIATLVWVIGTNSLPSIAYGKAMAFRAVVLDSSYKLRPSEPLPPSGNTIELEGARNEFETAQVVLTSTALLENVFVQVTALSGPGGRIPAEDVELFLIHYVTVEAPSDARGQAGEWPDALVPLRRPFVLKAGRHQPVILKVFLRPGLKGGIYRGRLRVTARSVPSLVVDVAVEVWDVTLPARVSLPVTVGCDYESIRKFEGGLPDPHFKQKILPRYYAALRRQRTYPFFVYALPEVREENGRLVLGLDEYRRQLEAVFAGQAQIPVGIPFFDSWPVDTTRHALFSNDYRRLAVDYLRQMAAFYDRLGLLDRAFLYIPSTDEPIEKRQYQQIRRFAELVRAADPRLRMLLTAVGKCMDCDGNEGIESLEHGAVLWVPNLAFFDDLAAVIRPKLFGLLGFEISSAPSGWTPEFAERVRRRGGEVWWYVNPWTAALPAAQQPTYPNILIDHQGIEHRVLGWMAFKYRVGAILHWEAAFWNKTSNPWTRLPHGEENPGTPPIAGDGSLLYPAAGSGRHTGQPDPDGPVVSLRLEMLREGSEDYELLNLLTQRGKGALAMEIAGGVVKSLREFERRPSEYRLARRRLAAAVLNQHSSPATPARKP